MESELFGHEKGLYRRCYVQRRDASAGRRGARCFLMNWRYASETQTALLRRTWRCESLPSRRHTGDQGRCAHHRRHPPNLEGLVQPAVPWDLFPVSP